MFRSIASYLTRGAVEKQNQTRKKLFLNWDKIERIALILDDASPVNKSGIDKFTEQTKKFIDVYFIELNSKTASYGDWICLTKKDRTWLGLPKAHIDSSLKNRNYQLVINAADRYDLFATALVSKINAPYTGGCRDLFGETDLVIEKLPGKNLSQYLDEVAKYLRMIKPQ